MLDNKLNILLLTKKALRKIFIFSFCISFLMLSGCMGFKAYWDIGADIVKNSYRIADELLARVKPPLNPNQCILVGTFANIDNLEQSSTFGRTLAECIASRLNQHGYKVIETKLRKSIFIKQKSGEYLLSRNVKKISSEHSVQVLFAGIYSEALKYITVSARIINVSDSSIIASYDYRIPLTRDILEMLREK